MSTRNRAESENDSIDFLLYFIISFAHDEVSTGKKKTCCILTRKKRIKGNQIRTHDGLAVLDGNFVGR